MVTTPDRWVVIKITAENESYYKVLAGWYGSYLDGQSWRLNSGISRVEREGDFYLFYGYSGSEYKCHVSAYGMNSVMRNILHTLQEIGTASSVELLKDQDFLNLLNEQESDV